MAPDTRSSSPTASRDSGSRGRLVLRVVFVLFAAYILTELAVNTGKRQWDFRSYYFAGKIALQGGNPYDGQALNQVSGSAVVLPFVYPPVTLPFFELFSRFDFGVAYQLWYVLKLLLTVLLLYMWRKYLFADVSADLFAWFMLLAFGATLYIDLVTGNITMIEQVLIWGGLIALIRGKLWIFSLLIVVAALFKITPLLFIVLLPLLGVRHGWRYVALSLVAIGAVVGAGYLLRPEAWHAFFSAISVADEPGQLGNPSTLALARDIVESIGQKTGAQLPQILSYGVYAGVVVTVVTMTLACARALRRRGAEGWTLMTIYMSCLAYALVMPRFKTYSFILVLPPALYLLTRGANIKSLGLLFALLALATVTPFPISPYLQYFWRYYPLFLVFMVWILLLGMLKRDLGAVTPAASASAPAT